MEYNANLNSFGDTIGIIESKFEKKYLIYGQNSWDIFSDYYGIKPNNDLVFYSWEHKPLISGSINYVGSYSNHKSKLFKTILDNRSNKISVTNISKNSKIRVWFRNY